MDCFYPPLISITNPPNHTLHDPTKALHKSAFSFDTATPPGISIPMPKQCTTCNEIKELSEFTKLKRSADGHAYKCKDCFYLYHVAWEKANSNKRRAREQAWKKSNPDKIRDRTLRRRFGITLEQYNQILISQNDVCKICSKPETAFDSINNKVRSLAVDHCHKTNKVRGLLCSNCNTAIGLLQDDPQLTQSATDYLRSETIYCR